MHEIIEKEINQPKKKCTHLIAFPHDLFAQYLISTIKVLRINSSPLIFSNGLNN